MKKIYVILGGFVAVVAVAIVWSKLSFQQEGNSLVHVSPCTGGVEVEVTTPCVIDTGEIPESGRGFFFRYPEDSGVTQSSLNVTTIEHGLLDELDKEIPRGPFYLITFYYNENVSIDSFNAMFADGKLETLAEKSVIKSSEAKFPNAEYPYATAYYLDNNGKKTIAIIAGYDSDMLKQAEIIFTEGFRWE